MNRESKEPKMLRGRERRGLPTRTPPFLIWGEVMVALSVLTHESEQESWGADATMKMCQNYPPA